MKDAHLQKKIGEGTRSLRRVVAIMATLGAFTAESSAGQQVVYAEIAPGVGASAELGGTGGFGETVFFSLYFFSEASALVTSLTLPGNQIADRAVLSISPGSSAEPPRLERCQLVDGFPVCDPLDVSAEFSIADNGEGFGEFLEIGLTDQGIDWDHDFLRVSIPEGTYELSEVIGDRSVENSRPSPQVRNAILPALSDLEQQYLAQRPFLRLDATPLLRQQQGDGGFDDIGLSFSGGTFRVIGRGDTRAQLLWTGAVATNDSVAFNHLTLDAGVARNLWPGDWLPLTLSARATSDQGFDAFDLSAHASLTFVLPFNLDFQSGAYRPALAPRLTLLGEWGSALERELPELEERFVRGGYEIQWRIPFGESELFRFRHAGLWNDPASGARDFHSLWDVQAEMRLGGATYFVGYQKGEAAPLFQRIEATRFGFSFSVADPTVSGR